MVKMDRVSTERSEARSMMTSRANSAYGCASCISWLSGSASEGDSLGHNGDDGHGLGHPLAGGQSERGGRHGEPSVMLRSDSASG